MGTDAPVLKNQTRWQRAGVLANPLRDFLLLIIWFNPEMFVYRLDLDRRMFVGLTNAGPER